MAYTAQELVTRSWYLSGIVARNLQTVTGDQLSDGLKLLNALLDWKTIQTDLIPYWTYKTDLVCVPGQEAYFIPNCLEIESVTFNIDVVRYPTNYVPRRTYFGSGRVDNIFTLPFNWNFNRSVGGGTLYLYFIPDQDYPLKIMCKLALTDVVQNTNMLTVYDSAYIEYLRYALAEYMCSEYGILFNPKSEAILKRIERQLMFVSPPDLSMVKSSILTQSAGGLSYADVNIGHGYRPS